VTNGSLINLKRARQQGLRGLEASVIGLVLVGCIAVGSGLGYWLDQRLGTSYWLPILFLVGVAAGFREMFRTISKMNQVRQSEMETSKQETGERSIFGQTALSSPAVNAAKTKQEADEAKEDRPRPRLFSVPPPPQSSFAVGPTSEPVRPASDRQVFDEPDTTAELIDKLLDDEELDEEILDDNGENGQASSPSR